MKTRAKNFLNIILLSALMLSGCGNENTSGEIDFTETTASQTESSVSTVSEITSETVTETDSETEVRYDKESLAYKAAGIIHNEYSEYQQGSFEDWNIGNDEPDLICASALVFDMNCDGKPELLSQKYTGTGHYFYTIYDIESGDMLVNYYGGSGNIYLDNGRIYLEIEDSPHDKIFMTVSDDEIDTAAYEEISAGYTDGYFYIGSRIGAVVCEYKKSGSLPKFEGTDSWCRYFSPESGFIYYEGVYSSQLEQMNSDFESNFDGYENIGEIRSLAYENYSDNNISAVWLAQEEVTDFDKLIEHFDFALSSGTEVEYGEYTYSPPSSAFELGFVRDNIIHKLEYTYYRNDGTAELPEYILADINSYADEWISSVEYDYKLDWIGVDMFDINSDGLDDYIVVGQIMDIQFISKEPGDAPYAPVEIIYVTDENGGLESINFPASYGKATTHNDHILSTKTNGYNDFIGSSHDGFLLISFDGKSTYSKVETLSDDYTWEYLDNGLVKLSCYDYRNENEIAVVKFLYDTGYTENIMLYSSLPDGTPAGSVPQAYGDNKFEFYVKRTDKAPEKWNDWAAGPIEIKYIPVNEDNGQ